MARLAVGNPSVRPRWSPPLDAAAHHQCGRLLVISIGHHALRYGDGAHRHHAAATSRTSCCRIHGRSASSSSPHAPTDRTNPSRCGTAHRWRRTGGAVCSYATVEAVERSRIVGAALDAVLAEASGVDRADVGGWRSADQQVRKTAIDDEEPAALIARAERRRCRAACPTTTVGRPSSCRRRRPGGIHRPPVVAERCGEEVEADGVTHVVACSSANTRRSCSTARAPPAMPP